MVGCRLPVVLLGPVVLVVPLAGVCVFLFFVVLVVSVVLDVLVVSVVGVVTIRCSFSAVDQSDCEDDYSTICRNVSYCEQQSFSRPHSLGRSFSTYT